MHRSLFQREATDGEEHIKQRKIMEISRQKIVV